MCVYVFVFIRGFGCNKSLFFLFFSFLTMLHETPAKLGLQDTD